jgi:hypothetical protein
MRKDIIIAVISALVGGVVTASIQYTLFQAQLKKDLAQFKNQAILDFLNNEYSSRKDRFFKIRGAVHNFISDPKDENIKIAISELFDMPFFRPRPELVAGSNVAIIDYTGQLVSSLNKYKQERSTQAMDQVQFWLERLNCLFDLNLRTIEYQIQTIDSSYLENELDKNKIDILIKFCRQERQPFS